MHVAVVFGAFRRICGTLNDRSSLFDSSSRNKDILWPYNLWKHSGQLLFKKAERLHIALIIHTAPPRVAPLPLPAEPPLLAGSPRVLAVAGEVIGAGLDEPLIVLASCLDMTLSVDSLRCCC